MDLKKTSKVFIIESPAHKDLEADRMEGRALSEVLNLADIMNNHQLVRDLLELEGALWTIADELRVDQKKWGGIHFHFSFHGNKKGLELTCGKFVNWRSFYTILKKINDSLGYYEMPYLPKFAPINLNFSSCAGFHAIKIKNMGPECPYVSLLGPTKAINWSDSLMAFSIYYHTILHKGSTIKRALKMMNDINGFVDIFQVDIAHFLELS